MDTPVWDCQSKSADASSALFVLPLAALDHSCLAVAGGKAPPGTPDYDALSLAGGCSNH